MVWMMRSRTGPARRGARRPRGTWEVDVVVQEARDPEDRRIDGLSELGRDDRRLLTPEVVSRWTDALAPGDEIPALEIVRLERGRQQTLDTIRQGAELTDLEFKLVRYFQRHERQTLTYQKIAHHLWGSTRFPITIAMLRAQDGYASPYVRHIWTLVSAIRKKLEIDPLRPQHLATCRGVGYRWYNAPPSINDGEDYVQRDQENTALRLHVMVEMGRPQLGPGPSHPDYEGPIEADITERRSRPHP